MYAGSVPLNPMGAHNRRGRCTLFSPRATHVEHPRKRTALRATKLKRKARRATVAAAVHQVREQQGT
jgi:hypothetical protein